MKTWRDFDVEAIRQLLDHHPRLQNASDAEKAARFALLMAHAEHLDISVPCKTCGVPFSLAMLDHACEASDIWLNRYVHDGLKVGYEPHKTTLQTRYPLQFGPSRVFRGANFATAAAFERFLRSLENGTCTFPTITSWTTDQEYAIRFARFRYPGPSLWRQDIVHTLPTLTKVCVANIAIPSFLCLGMP